MNNISYVLSKMKHKGYWNLINTIEFISFMTKVTIIVPGLLFNKQWWWLYIFALLSSGSLIWTSTRKTMPTIIIFNMIWCCLAVTAILKHFIF